MKKILLLLPLIILGYASFSQQDIKSRWIVNINGFRFTLHNAGDSIFKVKTDSVLFGKPTNLPFSTQSALNDTAASIRDSLNILRDSLAAYRAEDTVYTSSGIETVYSGDSTTIRLPYKSYVALLTQSGTDAPTAIVLQNDLGGTVVWSRSSTGNYIATLVGAFTENKSWCVVNDTNDASDVGYFSLKKVDSDSFVLDTFDSIVTPVDDLLINTSIEIRVYY